MFRKKRNVIALSLLLLITIASLAASMWLPHSPDLINPNDRLLGPSSFYWFGTDDFVRDIFAHPITAAKVSLFVGATVAFISTVIGTIICLISGYYKRADFMIMRIIDGMLAFPSLLLALALVAALGGNIINIITALTLAFSPVMARIVRSAVLQMNNVQFIDAAKTTGTLDVIILFRYILPNIITPIIVQGTFIFAKAILAEAALSFLGVGIDPTVPTWGNMLQEAQIYITMAPWFSIFPGIAIVLTVFLLNILGDGMRDAFNPHTKPKQRRKSLIQKTKLAQS